MKVENPAAYRFIIQDDVYLLPNDKVLEAVKLPESVEEPAIKEIVESEITLNYLGGHKKQFLILVHYPGHDFIAEAHLTALQNILKRKDHSMDDIAIFNIAKNNTDFEQLISYFKPQKLLVLGKKSIPIKLETPMLNQLGPIAGCMALYSYSFDEMMDNVDYKKIFWDQMKNL
jgi:hypothetical protein